MNLQQAVVQIVSKNKFIQNKRIFWLTNKQLLEKYEDFFHLGPKDKLRFRKNYKEAFRKSDEAGLKPIYDRFSKHTEPIAYVDEKGTKYDIFFDENTMELVPKNEKVTWWLIGGPGAGKTTKILSAPQMLTLISKYYDGFYFEYDYPLDTPERNRIEEQVKRFQRGKLPERDQLGAELQPVPLRFVWKEQSATITLVAEAGEELLRQGCENRAYESSRDGIMFLVSGRDLVRMIRGETETDTMKLLDKFITYALRMGSFGKHQKFMIIFNQIDKLKEEKNEHLQNVLSQNTICRDEDGHMILKNEGVLDMESMMQMQREMLQFLKETCPLFYGKLKQIACYCDVEIFVNADLNQEIEGLEYKPEEITPFRTDELWLFFLHLNGMAKSSKRANKFNDFIEWMKGDD